MARGFVSIEENNFVSEFAEFRSKNSSSLSKYWPGGPIRVGQTLGTIHLFVRQKKKKKEKEERLMGYINSKGKNIYIYIPPIGNFSIVEGTTISKIATTLNFLFREINL